MSWSTFGRSAKLEELRGIRRKFRAIKLHASSVCNHAELYTTILPLYRNLNVIPQLRSRNVEAF